MLKLLDAELLSTRMAASMIEMRTTLSSWPQLASDVVLGGASATVAIRTLLLGQPLASGRRFVDLHDAAHGGDAVARRCRERASLRVPALGRRTRTAPTTCPPRSCASSSTRCSRRRAATSSRGTSTGTASGCGCRATSSRAQRARWRGNGALLALGAAVENAVIAAAAEGCAATVEPFPLGDAPDVVAAMRLEARDAAALEPLAALRATRPRPAPRTAARDGATRRPCRPRRDRRRPPESMAPTFSSGPSPRRSRRSAGSSVRPTGSACCAPRRTRRSPASCAGRAEDATRTRDGITVSSAAPSASARAAVGLVMRPDVAAFLREVGGGSRLEAAPGAQFAAARAAGLLTLPATTSAAWLAGGRAMQRAWLAATARGLAFHPTTCCLPARAARRRAVARVHGRRDRDAAVARAAPVQGLRAPGGAAALLFRIAVCRRRARRSLRMPAPWMLSAGSRPHDRPHCLARTTDELDQVFALRHSVLVDEEGYMPAQPDGRLCDRFDAYPTTANVIALVDGRIVGAVRFIERTPAGTSADEFFDFRPFLPPAARDVTGGMLVLERAHRATPRLVFAMLGMGYYWAIGRGATHVIAPRTPSAGRRCCAAATGSWPTSSLTSTRRCPCSR